MTAGNDETHQDDESRKRRGRGEDSIYFDKSKGTWVGAISRGYAPSGTRRRPKVYGRTKTEVRNKLRDLRKELETGVKSAARYTVAWRHQSWPAVSESSGFFQLGMLC